MGAGRIGFPCGQFSLQLLLFLFQFRQQLFVCKSHVIICSMAAFMRFMGAPEGAPFIDPK